MRCKLRHSAAAALVAVLVPVIVAVLGARAVPPQPDLAARAPGLAGYGQVEWTVSTASPAAQRLYTQGVPQAYAFHEVEAVRMFKAALAQGPNCAVGLGRGAAARAQLQQHQPQRRQGSAAPPGPRTAPRHRHSYRHQYQGSTTPAQPPPQPRRSARSSKPFQPTLLQAWSQSVASLRPTR